MKIQKIKLENVGLAQSGEFDIAGNHVLVTGGNGQGKTSFVRAFERICTKAMPHDIVREGEAKAAASFVMEDGTKLEWVQWQNEAEPTIILTLPDGSKKNKPAQKLLAELVGSTIDVNKDFISATPLARKAFVAAISGIDLDAYDKAIKVAEDNRALVKRDADTLKKRAEGYSSALPTVPVSVDELQSAHAALVAANAQQEKEAAAAKQIDADIEKNKAEGARCLEQIEALEAQITALKNRVSEIKKSNGELLQRQTKAIDHIAANHRDLSAEIEAARKAVAEAAATNTKIALNAKAKADYDAWMKAASAVEQAEQAVADARNEKLAAAKAANFPAGLSIGEGGELQYTDSNGVTVALDSVNEAAKTIIGLKCSLHTIGSVKCVALEVSHLDKAARKEVLDWATANDLQIFAERVTDDDQVQIQILS